MKEIDLAVLTNIVEDLYNLSNRNLILKDITAEKIERKAAELDAIFETNDFTLYVKDEFISSKGSRAVNRALYQLIKVVKMMWSYEVSKKRKVRQAVFG